MWIRVVKMNKLGLQKADVIKRMEIIIKLRNS